MHSVSEMNQDITIGAVVQLVRIHACHAWGRGFESRPHRKKKQKCFFFCYILPTYYQLRVLDGFIPYFSRYHSDTTLNLYRRNSEGRAKHCRTFAVKNFTPFSSVKKQVINQVIKWVCQTLTHPLYLIMVIGFIPLPLYST